MAEDAELPSDLQEGQDAKQEYSRAAARARKEQEARLKVEEELATLRAAQRTSQLAALLPAGVDPSVYPADQPVSEDAVQAFVRDKLGMTPEAMDKWRQYEQMSGQTEPPMATDEDEVWAAKEAAVTARFYQRQNAPTEAEIKELEELKMKLFPKMNEWDQRVSEGRMDVLIDPSGFGGLTDPPPWARRARHAVVSSMR